MSDRTTTSTLAWIVTSNFVDQLNVDTSLCSLEL